LVAAERGVEDISVAVGPRVVNGSLRRQAAAGVRWTTTSSVATTILGLAQLALLTRLLDREDFGLMAMIATVLGFANVFADMGFSNAIIARKETTREQLSTLYWTNILTGFVLFVVVLAVSPLVVDFYGQPRLQGPLVLASFTFLLTPFGQQFQILFQKHLAFRRLAVVETGSMAAGAIVAVTAAAFAGAGVYALVVGQLTQTGLRATAFAVSGWRAWRPQFHVARSDLRGYVSFGLYQMGERGIYYWAANVDYLLIGRFLGADALGVYTIAYQLVVMPVAKLNPVLTKVAFPIFARRRDDLAALRKGFGELIELVSFVGMPVLVGLAVTATVAVPVLVGDQWQESVVLVQILALMGILKMISNPTGSLFLARGRADLGFWINVAFTAVTVTVLWAVVDRGVVAVAWGHTVINVVFFFVEYVFIRKVCGLGFGAYMARLARPALAVLLMGAAIVVAFALWSPPLGEDVASLIVLVAVGIATYALSWLAIDRAYPLSLWRLLVARRREAV
jgi:O-antigen/teichoic acid export membrane protein